MTEPVERWERFVKIDAAVTLLAAIVLWGIYGYWLIKLDDFLLLGMIVAFLIDLCGLAAVSVAAAVLLFSWRKKKSAGVLIGTILQLLYGLPYGGFLLTGRAGGFITPAMAGGVCMLATGAVGLVLWIGAPREDWR